MNRWMILGGLVFLVSCAAPKYGTVSGEKLNKTQKFITLADLPTGERFEFNYPGARLSIYYRIVFGRTEEGRFRTIPLNIIQNAWAPDKISPERLDTTSVIKRMELVDGERILFDVKGAQYYDTIKCVSGTVANGETITLPVSRIEQGETFKNFEEYEASEGVKGFFVVIGILGLLALRIAAKLAEDKQD